MSDKFRFIFDPCIGSGSYYCSDEYDSYEQANASFELIAGYTLFLHDSDLMKDHSNYGFIEKLVDGEWLEEFDI